MSVLAVALPALGAGYSRVYATEVGQSPIPGTEDALELVAGSASQQVDLWVVAGDGLPSSLSNVCDGGATPADGDETCGAQITLVAGGALKFIAFAPEIPNQVVYHPTDLSGGVGTLHINGLDIAAAPRDPAHFYLGRLTVDTTGSIGAGAFGVMAGGKRVGANLAVTSLDTIEETAFVPEPSSLLLLGSGALGLLVFGRRGALR